jgi:signal transduction histidine kinase
VRRRQEDDVSRLLPTIRHLTERQYQLFFLFQTLIARPTPQGLTRLVDSDIAEGLPALYADERKLKQILLNLMSNAVKFTRPGGKVALRAWSRAGDGYVFQVADTGIGIALKDIPKVLDAFKQVDSGLNREFEGTGLGLPLSKALAELHGASLDLQSERGVGTTVTVRFPAERIVPETAAETAAE